MHLGLGCALIGLTLLGQSAPQLGEPRPGRKSAGTPLKDLTLLAPNPSTALRDELMALGVRTQKHDQGILFVDGAGVVRRVFPANAPDRAIVDDAKLWLRGQGVYASYCQRCHGADGRDTSYPGTRSLSGMGKTKSEAQILEISGRAGSVNMAAFSERDLKALGVFLAGL